MKLKRYIELEKQGIINGCGAKGSFSFDVFFEQKIKLFNNFLQEKLKSLEWKVKLKCCGPHDVRFTNGGLLIAFIYANYKFSKDLYSVLNWTCTGNRVFAFIASFLGLMIGGISAFNWCMPWNKKNISIK